MFDPFRPGRARREFKPPHERRHHHPDFSKLQARGWKAALAEAELPADAWAQEQRFALENGLPGADSIGDKTISTFARGELPHFAGELLLLRLRSDMLDHAVAEDHVEFTPSVLPKIASVSFDIR